MDNKDLSLKMAKRLKEERQNKNLSHISLSKALKENYGIDISKDSLQNYEVSSEAHTKSYTNNGMRIEYLRCLADFYCVSTDYLLGLSEIRTRNETIQAIHNQTGLSQKAIVRLKHDKEVWGNPYIPFLNRIIESKDLVDLSRLVDSYNKIDADSHIRLDMIPETDNLDNYEYQATAFLKALLSEYFFKVINDK